MVLLKVTLAFDGQTVPVLLGKQGQADFFKLHLLLEVPLLLTLCFIIIFEIIVFIAVALSAILSAGRYQVVLVVVDDTWSSSRLRSLAYLAGEDVTALFLHATACLLLPVRGGGRSITTSRWTAWILNQLVHV